MPSRDPRLHHYIPQHYLRGFCSGASPGQLWVYTKGQADIYQTGLTAIAAENNFYLLAIERILAREIESPAEAVLKKIRAREDLMGSDRQVIAVYLAILHKRVPGYRDMVRAITPEVQAQEFARLRMEFVDSVTDSVERNKNRAEIDALEVAWRHGPPPEVQRRAEQPLSSGEIEAQLLKMSWYFLVASGYSRYVTCDNPVFVFKALGLNKPTSELSCPLSRDVALLVKATPLTWGQYAEVPERIVQEINRRSINNATSRVLYAEKADWLERMVQKPRLRLNRIAL